MTTNNAINNPGNSFLTPANNLSDVSTPETARLNLFVPLSVTASTILPATAYGKEVICTGSSAYALTLPTVTSNSNKFIDIFSQTTSGAIVTITPASGTIAGQSTLAIGSGDGVRIMNDGTNWWVLNQWLQPAVFRVTRSTTQSIPTGSITKIAYDTVAFDTGSFFDIVTNHRYRPLLPGKYFFYQNITFDTVASNPVVEAGYIEINGSILVQGLKTLTINSQQENIDISAIYIMNGSTDFMEGFCFQASGGNLDIQATATNNTTSLTGNRISLF